MKNQILIAFTTVFFALFSGAQLCAAGEGTLQVSFAAPASPAKLAYAPLEASQSATLESPPQEKGIFATWDELLGDVHATYLRCEARSAAKKAAKVAATSLDVAPVSINWSQYERLKNGLRQELVREILRQRLYEFETQFNELATRWIARSLLALDQKYRDERVWDEKAQRFHGAHDSRFRHNAERVQLSRLDLKNLANAFTRRLLDEGQSMIEASYKAWINGKDPQAGAKDPLFYAYVRALHAEFIHRLNEVYPLSSVVDLEKDPDFKKLVVIETFSGEKFHSDADGGVSIALPRIGIEGRFDPNVQTVFIKALNTGGRSYFNNVLAPGDATYGSNAASWANVLPFMQAMGIHATSFDPPGRMGKLSVGVQGVETPAELAKFFERVFAHSQAEHPEQSLHVDGRSMGSLEAYTHALFVYLSQQGVITGDFNPKLVTSYLLSSPTNPTTIDDQFINVRERGEVGAMDQVMLPGAEERIKSYCGKLLQVLSLIHESHPKALQTFGDRLFVPQGISDFDGKPRGAGTQGVLPEIIKFMGQNAPLAHIYKVDDPLAGHPYEAVIRKALGLDMTEGTHFLFTARANFTEDTVPPVVRDLIRSGKLDLSLLPRLRDQLYEVLALSYASLDYVIDLSPLRPENLAELTEQRQRQTGSHAKFAYLRSFLSTRLQLDFDQVDASQTEGRDSLAQRMKRVINFVRSEAERVSAVAGQPLPR